ncbi:hypothetical protein MHAS_02039 [Mycolicibacterium hassiacum DSM 44199]|jgi:hypothetical protein|nr:DUF2752 domain-containing protein [Mycolicibacterium hassiacum]MBX5487871.1 DUF2752 domain-containing protein [Mycolicibacterium hassiacum]MDA4085927.1 membrane protein [Mycolicibacterium hassiacum DSM 44199]PZN17854.1 MAG: DUF2752 domain-containing protein [Mycolicibacterium hassiacum]VCT90334.1 hypothetical protein MHAS_02039 [Mycolicibacterium hassiacum DSM 44199]
MASSGGRSSIQWNRATVAVLLGAGGLLAAALAYIGIADPHRPGFFYPPCMFHKLTGWLCPGCGGLRMTHDLLHGDLAAAVNDNVFALVGIPLLIGWFVLRWRTGRRLITRTAVVVIITAVVTWTVVRNLPGFPLIPTVVAG